MTPNSYLYFDYYQSTDTEHDPLAIGGYLPLERVYSFEPTAGIPEEYKKYVTGVQANLWTEYIPTFSQVEYMVLPRMDALAEVQWTNAPKDFKAFLPRLVRMTELYDRLGYNYAKHIFDIRASFTTDGDKGEIVVTLETEGSADIHYTLDGANRRQPARNTSPSPHQAKCRSESRSCPPDRKQPHLLREDRLQQGDQPSRSH